MTPETRSKLVTRLRRPHIGTWQPSVLWHLRHHLPPYDKTYDAWTILADLYIEEAAAAEWYHNIVSDQRGRITVQVSKLEIERWSGMTVRQGNKLDTLCATLDAEGVAEYINRNW